MSEAANSSAIEPKMKYKKGGYPSFKPVGLLAAWKPQVMAAAAIANATRSALKSKMPTSRFLRLAVIHPVATR